MQSAPAIRVRFAPSPTGGLHLGGVRTVLYNYLFAKKYSGKFILRIEDTDQNRFVPGAEAYIFDCLRWCRLEPDESVLHGGDFGPYRQSERKPLYRDYAEQLVAAGNAYYAFDTPEELEEMRQRAKTEQNPAPQYDATQRMLMRNSLTLSEAETNSLLQAGTKHVIRIKMPADETVVLQDMIRGEVRFQTNQVDDKVLLKADGMPTYHLAVVVDDYLMKISHAFRGEEWLPSAPVHVLLWQYLGWQDQMPQWAHLPLILGPSGKLSKRDGATYGFPVFAMNWTDPATGETVTGFKETGFLPEAFINLLALLGWNDGSGQELFNIDELVQAFSMERVHSGGAKFDFEKAKWFNHEWIKKLPATRYLAEVKAIFQEKGVEIINDERFEKILELVKDRCHLLTDFYPQAVYFYQDPVEVDIASIQPKWNEAKQQFFAALHRAYEVHTDWDAASLELLFKEISAAHQLKTGELMLPLRIMLVGGKFGPGVFDIAAIIGQEATLGRIEKSLALLQN
jgi:glutamyl-tRNA synthetase